MSDKKPRSLTTHIAMNDKKPRSLTTHIAMNDKKPRSSRTQQHATKSLEASGYGDE